MSRQTGSIRLLLRAAAVAALLAGLPLAASGEGPDACPLLFPDLRCERSGRYEGFVTPMITPYLFEDPFVTTGIQAVGIWHDFPGSSAFGGGDAWVAALQVRVAITERLAFIATKDGYAFFDAGNPTIGHQDGFFDIAAGLKYALIDRPEDDLIVSPSLRFDVPVGQDDVFSGNGDGVVIPAISAAWGLGDFHAIGSLGGRVPFSTSKESTSIFYALHLDYAVFEHLVPFVELSGSHWTDGGKGKIGIPDTTIRLRDASLTGFEGADVANLGTQGVAGNDVVTLGFGARIPVTTHLSLGGAYEFPVTSREGIFHQRVTMSVVLEY